MRFTINSKVYTVGIAARPIILCGEALQAKIDHLNGRIWLSGQLAPTDRRKQLFHEFRHGWVVAHGRATGDEADADQFADAAEALMDQYLTAGGDAVLEAMQPVTDAQVAKMTATMALREAECGHCHAPTAVGSIACGKPEFSPVSNVFVMDRGILCEVCDCVTCWREVCTEAGEPTGAIVPFPPPRVLNGAEAGEWIAEHRETARIRVLA